MIYKLQVSYCFYSKKRNNMVHSQKIFSLIAVTIILLPDQVKADTWEHRHDERKAIHKKMDKVERAEKEKINKENKSWRQKHKERKAEHAKIKAQEAKEKAQLDDKDNTWRKRKAKHTEKHSQQEAQRLKSSNLKTKK